jgi:5'-nucleotidase
MTALMNFVGFDASAFGNHEFDSKQKGLRSVLAYSHFPHLCANIQADTALHITPLPYKIFDVEGVRIGVLSVVQLGTHDMPDAHPNLLKGMSFTPVEETIRKYLWLRDKVDVFILLSHIGYEDDVEMANKFPCFDLIIGGHTHTQLKGGEMHNGVLVTQNVNKLKRVTLTTIKVEEGKVISKEAKNIEVEGHQGKNLTAQAIVDSFNNNPEFQRQLAWAEEFCNVEELGSMMCDAMIEEAEADLAIENYGGVRYDKKEAGPFTIHDVLRLDPFGNPCIEMTLTGEEFRRMLISCFDNSQGYFPFVGGVVCHVQLDKEQERIIDLKLFTLDGKKFNLKKKYKVVTNSFVAAICDEPRSDQGTDIGMICSDMLMHFLEKKGKVDYRGVKRINFIQ